eukprot:708870_1
MNPGQPVSEMYSGQPVAEMKPGQPVAEMNSGQPVSEDYHNSTTENLMEPEHTQTLPEMNPDQPTYAIHSDHGATNVAPEMDSGSWLVSEIERDCVVSEMDSYFDD